jgi:SET family sugar efflux transporter-like MFS transporter
VKRLTTSSSALLWGLQFAFLNPVLALLLVTLFHATSAEVGGVLAVYNAGGFIASLVIPGWADRSANYLRGMLICAALTVALAAVLSTATSLPIAVVALIVLGGPAGVGSTLLYAELKHSGASASDVMNTRAIVSFAWVAGPPLATLIMGVLGNRSILPVLAGVGLLNVATTLIMMSRRRSAPPAARAAVAKERERQPVRKTTIAAITGAFILLQATNSAAVSVMSLFVTAQLGLPVIWAGITLGAAALLEIPALWLIGRLSHRFSGYALIISGCVAGALYYAAMTFVRDPATLIMLQILNAWFFGVVVGIGMTMYQQIIPRPGLATGLFMNTRRIGAILSGPIIALASIKQLGYPGLFALCAVLTVVALIVIEATRRAAGRVNTPGPPHHSCTSDGCMRHSCDIGGLVRPG